jgi:UMP-CMP kinase
LVEIKTVLTFQFAEPHLALFFQCPWELAKERVVNRREGREGDNSECFDKRYKEYIDENPAILNYYGSVRGKDKLIEVSAVVAGFVPFC